MKKTATILDGQKIAHQIKLKLRREIKTMKQAPSLAAILVGDSPASALYVKLKRKAALEVGIMFHQYLSTADCYPNISEKELIELIKFLNHDPNTNGILLQLPLPKQYHTDKIIKTIDPAKDVDGFHPKNKNSQIIPPTIGAIVELLTATKQNLTDKKTLIIGNSDIFTCELKKYLTSELKIKNITTKKSTPKNSTNFDVIIIALGQAKVLKKTMVKPGAIVIDVGINQQKDMTVGDVDEDVKEVAGFVSPVPGGVGPLTVAKVLENTVKLAQIKNSSRK